MFHGNRHISGSECRDTITPGSKSSGNDSSELRHLKVFPFLNLYLEPRVPDPGFMELFLGKGSMVYLSPSVPETPGEVRLLMGSDTEVLNCISSVEVGGQGTTVYCWSSVYYIVFKQVSWPGFGNNGASIVPQLLFLGVLNHMIWQSKLDKNERVPLWCGRGEGLDNQSWRPDMADMWTSKTGSSFSPWCTDF